MAYDPSKSFEPPKPDFGSIPPPSERGYQHEEKKMEYGLLGKFFGASDKAPQNIAGLVCIIILLIMAFALYKSEPTPAGWEFLKALIPVLTLILGYLVGTKSNN